MKILHVIHGYPPFYMAGSEVYTWNLCRQLASTPSGGTPPEVHVFTRIENPYAAPYAIEDAIEDGVHVRRVNKPGRDYTFRDKALDPRMDDVFRQTLREVRPDVVHVGHLSHLSTQLPLIAKRELGVPVVFTLHDYWLHCFRGQLVEPDLTRCEGPSDQGCLDCARTFFKDQVDAAAIAARRAHVEEVLDAVDRFLVPSQFLARFVLAQGVPKSKVTVSRYGFDTARLAPVARGSGGTLRIGFLGRIIPVKGVDLLLRAFRATKGDARLEVWGSVGADRPWLERLAEGDDRITFRGGYHNGQLRSVLEDLDVTVAPSVWVENSPLVIQESFLAGVPVITSDAGGMAELVQHGENGLLFPLGDEAALSGLLQSLIDHPERLEDLRPSPASVRTIEDDAASCLALYRALAPTAQRPLLPFRPAPWRVTLVTNPGLCNLTCPMCDTHSPFAPETPDRTRELDFGLVRRTLTDLADRGLREVIPSTMGEPLLYPRFDELLDLVAGLGLRLNLTTNGTFPHGGVTRWAPKLLPVMSDVKFSLNGIGHEVNGKIMAGVRDGLQRRNIDQYLALKADHEADGGQASTTSLQVTFMESNLEELPALLSWAIAQGVDRFKGHHLWVVWPELAPESLRRSPDAIARWNAMADRLHAIAERDRLPDGRAIRLQNVLRIDPERLHPDPDKMVCPFLGQEGWVEADGSFQVCCCPSTLRQDFGDFGNLEERSLIELWRSPAYRDFVEGWGEHPHCRTCNMRQPVEERDDA